MGYKVDRENIIDRIIAINILGFIIIVIAQVGYGYLHFVEVKEYVFRVEAERVKKTAEVIIEDKFKDLGNMFKSFVSSEKIYDCKRLSDDGSLRRTAEGDVRLSEFDAVGIYTTKGLLTYLRDVELSDGLFKRVLQVLNGGICRKGGSADSVIHFFYRCNEDVYLFFVYPLKESSEGHTGCCGFAFAAISVEEVIEGLEDIFPSSYLSYADSVHSTGKVCAEGYNIPLKDLSGAPVAFICIPIPDYVKLGLKRIVFIDVFLGIFLLIYILFVILVLRFYYIKLREEVKNLVTAIDSIGSLKPDMVRLRELSFKEGEIGDVFRSVLSAAESIVYNVSRDSLTGAYNRKFFFDKLKDELERAKRYKRPMSLVLLDIDNFKKINDKYGHPFGDKVLKEVSNLVMSKGRSTDYFARVGGEEFAIILPETDVRGAEKVCERLRKAIEALKLKANGEDVNVTVSFGVTQAKETDTVDSLYERADRALYMAKRGGKNRVVILY